MRLVLRVLEYKILLKKFGSHVNCLNIHRLLSEFVLPDEGCQTTALLLLLFVCLFVLTDESCQTTALLLLFVCLFARFAR